MFVSRLFPFLCKAVFQLWKSSLRRSFIMEWCYNQQYNSTVKTYMIALFQLSRTGLYPAGHIVYKPDPN